MPGRPRSRMTSVGAVALRERERRLARACEVDRVASRAEVRGQRAQDLRLVVDDEDRASSRPPRSRRTIVSPPPGVSSTSTLPPIASTKPARDGQPEPDARALRAVAEALERDEDAVAIRWRDAGPTVDDAEVDAAVDGAGDDAHRRARRRAPRAFCDDVGDRPLEQPGIGDDAGERLGHVDVDRRPRAGPMLAERGRVRPRRGRWAWRRPRSAPVWRRLMSSRLPTSAVEAVGLLVDRREEVLPLRLAASRSRPASRRRHGRLDTGERACGGRATRPRGSRAGGR